MMAGISHNAYLKVKRANEHIDTLLQRSSPLPNDLYEITNGPARSVVILINPDRFEFAYRPKELISEYFSPIIGDAVNNLREAMDLWINAVDRARSGRGNLHFPFAAEWKDLEAAKTYEPIRKSFPELADFIVKDIKPCRDTNLNLWAATSLCNFNKHNDFLPNVSVVRVQGISAFVGTNTIQDCSVRGNANRKIVMIAAGQPIIANNNHLRVTVDITFPKGAVFEDQPVIPTLTQMSQVVSETLGALDAFVATYV